jgi:15-cis-phytoene synthase
MSAVQDRQICEEITERSGPNFSIGFRTLPDEKRWAIQASYAFCRIADDLADEPVADSGLQSPLLQLQRWREELDRVYHAQPTHPVSRALAHSLQKFGIPQQSFSDLIDGCERDLEFQPPRTQQELEDYCDLVATSMGQICLSVFGSIDPRTTTWARDLSHALQVTNILRDIREDFERGRVYLPQSWMEDAGVDAGDLVSSAPRLGWYEVMSRGVAFARTRYAQSLHLVHNVDPDSRLAVALMRGVYMEILRQIEEDPCRVLRERISLSSGQRAAVVKKVQFAAGSASASF